MRSRRRNIAFLCLLALAGCSPSGPDPDRQSSTADGGGNAQSGNGGSSAGGVSVGGVSGTSSTGGAGQNSGTGGALGGADAGDASLGGSGTGGSNGGTDANGWTPCPEAGSRCPVMPVGDSITFGADATIGLSKTQGGYRTHLFELAHQANKGLTFVGSLNDGPETFGGIAFPKAHEGHPGWVILQIADIIAASLKEHKPRIVILMIGTNDINAGFDPPHAPNRVATLVDTILKTVPDALLVVAQLIPTESDSENTTVQTYNTAIAALVAERKNDGKHVLRVDMYSAFANNSNFKDDYLSDNLHPNDDGYQVMAQTWFAAIAPYLR